MSGRASVTAALRRCGLRNSSDVALVGLAMLLSAFVLYAMQDSIIDDGYINLGYVKMLSEHFEWGMLPGVPANTATSPLNVLVTSAVAAIVRSPMAAMWIVAIATAAILAIGLLALSRDWRVGRRFAWIAVVLIVLNPLLASTTGLETIGVVTLTVWLLARAAAGDWRTYGWLCGLGLLLRTDLVVVMAVIWLCHPALWRREDKAGTLAKLSATAWRAAIVALPWFVFSWIYFGSAIPDTFAMKTTQPNWGGPFVSGLTDRYLPLYPTAVWSALVICGAGVLGTVLLPLFLRTRYRDVVAMVASAAAAAVVYFVLYCLLGVPPYFWYYGLPVAMAAVVASWVVSAGSTTLFTERAATWTRVAAGVAAAALFLPTGVTWVRDLSRHTPLREAPIHGNWALTPQYRQIGLDLADRVPPGAVVRSAGEFAVILYYCDCTLLDRFDDRAMIEKTLLEAKDDGSTLMRLNYLLYDPAKYERPKTDFHLVYERGWTDDPQAWNVFSPTRGRGHLTLVEGARPRGAASTGTVAPG